MQTRCAYADCLEIFQVDDQLEFKKVQCIACNREFTARTVARHLEIDKQSRLHLDKSTHAMQFLDRQENLHDLKFVAILEEIRSLWNVGSMFRSADGAGFQHLFLVGITGCPPRREIAKTSLGAEDHVGWSYAADSLSVINKLKAAGFQILGLEKTDSSIALSLAIKREQLRRPLCLVLGNEVKGVYSETLQACDQILDLPMLGFKESLNVAVAFGVASYFISEWDLQS